MKPLFTLKPLSIVLSAILMTGCAVGPDYKVPAPEAKIADDFAYNQATSQEVLTSPWWKQFNDPVLDQLIEQSKTDNYSIKIAAERVKLAESYRSAVSAAQLPQIGLGAGYSKTSLSRQGPVGGPLDSTSNLLTANGMPGINTQLPAFYAGATIGWEPDLFNRMGYMEDAATARADQLEIMAYGTELLVTGAVAENYLQLRGAQQQRNILDQQINDLERLQNKVTRLVENGLASSAEQASIDSVVSAAKSMRPQVETAIKVHMHRIAILLGKPPLSLVSELTPATAVPEMKGMLPVGLPSDLLKRRPDIRIAEREMKIANAEMGIAIANQYPRFYLTGAPGSVSTDFDDLFSSGSDFWNATAGVQWNLFDGGLREAMEAAAESRTHTSALAYQRTILQAFGEVESLLSAYGNSQQAINDLEQALASANTAIEKVETLKQSGLASTPDVLKARMDVYKLESAVAAAKTQHAGIVVALYKSLGGHWKTS